MTRYQIREALVSIGDDFDISDESGRPVYHVDGKVLTINDHAAITDMQGRSVASIHRKLVAIRHVWVVEIGGQEVAKVRKDLINIIGDHFVIDRSNNDLDVRGDIFHHNYRIDDRSGKRVADVNKRWITLTDTYGVEVAEGEDDLLILASVVAMDAMYARDEDLRRAAAAAAASAQVAQQEAERRTREQKDNH